MVILDCAEQGAHLAVQLILVMLVLWVQAESAADTADDTTNSAAGDKLFDHYMQYIAEARYRPSENASLPHFRDNIRYWGKME